MMSVSSNNFVFLQIGALVQLVRIHACHAWGHEFESRTHRKANSRLKQALKFKDFRVFYFSPLRQKIAVLGSPYVAYSWDFLKAGFAPTN